MNKLMSRNYLPEIGKERPLRNRTQRAVLVNNIQLMQPKAAGKIEPEI